VTRHAASGGLLLLAAATLTGCVYYNGLYNAEAAFRRAEEARLRGFPDSADAGYAAAARGATRAWEAEPEGEYAGRALLLAARAALRGGDPARARIELDRIETLPGIPEEVTQRARVLRAAVLVTELRPSEAFDLLQSAVLLPEDSEWRAESWLWTARALDAMDRFDEAWASWDFAAVNRGDLRWSLEAERVGRAVTRDRPSEASVSLEKLLSERPGEAWVDTVLVVVGRAERRWGSGVAAELLEPIRRDRWGPAARDRVLLRQADLLLSAGDTSGAATTLEWVAEGTTEGAAGSRVTLAQLQLAMAETFAELGAVRRTLLPLADRADARTLLLRISETELLAQWGTEGDVLAWFAAGEVARDVLGARELAGALFLTAAGADQEGRWVGKSLLAALTAFGEARVRESIRTRALGQRLDPWVERLRTGYLADGQLGRLEDELDERVRALRMRASAEAERLHAITPADDDR